MFNLAEGSDAVALALAVAHLTSRFSLERLSAKRAEVKMRWYGFVADNEHQHQRNNKRRLAASASQRLIASADFKSPPKEVLIISIRNSKKIETTCVSSRIIPVLQKSDLLFVVIDKTHLHCGI